MDNMMLVTVGTIQFPFGRMVKVVSKIIKQYPKLQIEIQSGHTTGFNQLRKHARVRPFIPQHELWQLMEKSDILLMHGGEGSLLDAIEWSPNLPIVFPRDMKYGEHVDNYQADIAQAADAKNLCRAAFSPNQVLKRIAAYYHQKHRFKNNAQTNIIENTPLIQYLTQTTRQWHETE